MTDHLTMAREFLDEQLDKRDDIVASYVYGSVARGESNETSDIDIALIVEGEPDKTAPGAGVDAWRDSTYIEASLFPKSRFENLEGLLEHTYLPNTLYHGRILYDPAGFLTAVQDKLRTVFMEPRWVNSRVKYWLDAGKEALPEFAVAITSEDHPGICAGFATLAWSFITIPILVAGYNPGSIRSFTHLGEFRPDLRDRLCELEYSSDLDVDELTDLLALTTQVSSSADLAGKRRYFLNKIAWMIENDLAREALHTMWFCFGTLIARQNKEDQSALALGAELSKQWLQKVGWEGEDVLRIKSEAAHSLMTEMEQLAIQ